MKLIVKREKGIKNKTRPEKLSNKKDLASENRNLWTVMGRSITSGSRGALGRYVRELLMDYLCVKLVTQRTGRQPDWTGPLASKHVNIVRVLYLL